MPDWSILAGIYTVAIVRPCRVSAQVKRWKDKHYLGHIIVKGMDNWHACHRCPKGGLLMTAKLHLAPGMCRGRSQTSEHQTALSSVNLIALDTRFIGSRRPKERPGAKAEPDFLSHISFSSVSHALVAVLGRRGVFCYYCWWTGSEEIHKHLPMLFWRESSEYTHNNVIYKTCKLSS